MEAKYLVGYGSLINRKSAENSHGEINTFIPGLPLQDGKCIVPTQLFAGVDLAGAGSTLVARLLKNGFLILRRLTEVDA